MKFTLKKNNILLLICSVLLPVLMQSQTPDFNLKKYWHLRWRLTNYFMVVGEGSGKSIPGGIREKYFNNMVQGINQNPSTHA